MPRNANEFYGLYESKYQEMLMNFMGFMVTVILSILLSQNEPNCQDAKIMYRQ